MSSDESREGGIESRFRSGLFMIGRARLAALWQAGDDRAVRHHSDGELDVVTKWFQHGKYVLTDF